MFEVVRQENYGSFLNFHALAAKEALMQDVDEVMQ
jgi:hypothetical protein